MEIIGIFAHIKGSLISVKYDDCETDEFEKIFDRWTDVEYLFNFFHQNIDDLKSGFYGNISVEDAIERTIDEAEKLEKEILHISVEGIHDDYKKLQTIFKPLDNFDYRVKDLQKSKAYGSQQKSWLRIYAIKIAPNTFVISGGGIKLTPTMNEREHLKTELVKLETVKTYLIDNGLLDEDDFEYLETK